VYVDALVSRDRDLDGNGTLDERVFVQQDANFNVTALVNASGQAVERYAYDPYGRALVYDGVWTLRPGGSAYGMAYQHQGLRYDARVGLTDNRRRVYRPDLMRFLQTDPEEFGTGDPNFYRYQHNTPVNRVDPSGLADTTTVNLFFYTATPNFFFSRKTEERIRFLFFDCVKRRAKNVVLDAKGNVINYNINISFAPMSKTAYDRARKNFGIKGKDRGANYIDVLIGIDDSITFPRAGQQGGNECMINSTLIRREARDLRVDPDVAIGSSVAHEVFHHLIANAWTHTDRPGFVDSARGSATGVFTDEACDGMLKKLGIPVK
jgi:RHS repeat-associated protein